MENSGVNWLQTLITIIGAVIASSGFWTYVQKKSEKKDVKTLMLMGLAHDRIIYLGMCYIDRGYITHDEYENLYDYLYKPYKQMDGNGSAHRIIDEVKKLPIRKGYFNEEGKKHDQRQVGKIN